MRFRGGSIWVANDERRPGNEPEAIWQTVTIVADIATPATPGQYSLVFELLQERDGDSVLFHSSRALRRHGRLWHSPIFSILPLASQ